MAYTPHVIGIDIHGADWATLSALSVHGSDADPLYETSAAQMPDCELVVLSTCHRVEFYVAAEEDDVVLSWLSLLPRALSAWSDEAVFGLQHLSGREAAAHLFRVASGLDSAILGELEILAQVREARDRARAHGTLGPTLDALFSDAISTSRRVRAETGIGDESLGIGPAVAARIENATGTHSPPAAICVLGAGAAARAVIDALDTERLASLTVIARDVAKADAFATRPGIEVQPWTTLEQVVRSADVVVAATSSRQPIVDGRMIRAAISARQGLPPVLIDLSHRPNIEVLPEAPVIDLTAICSVDAVLTDALEGTRKTAESIVATHVLEWLRRSQRGGVEPLVQSLYLDADAALEDLGDMLDSAGNGDLRPELRRRLRKVLHAHASELRSWAKTKDSCTTRSDTARGRHAVPTRGATAAALSLKVDDGSAESPDVDHLLPLAATAATRPAEQSFASHRQETSAPPAWRSAP
jgi:glutamyl-tRNA reductase